MLGMDEIKKLIRMRYLDFGIAGCIFPEGSEEDRSQQLECEKLGLTRKPVKIGSIYYEYGIKIPFIQNENLAPQEEKQIRNEGTKVQQLLLEKQSESLKYLKTTYDFIAADAYIPEITIFPKLKEIKIIMANVTDRSNSRITTIKVHMYLKEVKQYQIMKIENGIVTTDDQKKQLSLHYNFIGGTIQDDYYEICQDEYFTLLILIPWIKGWCIQVDYKTMEIEKELMEDNELGTQG